MVVVVPSMLQSTTPQRTCSHTNRGNLFKGWEVWTVFDMKPTFEPNLNCLTSLNKPFTKSCRLLSSCARLGQVLQIFPNWIFQTYHFPYNVWKKICPSTKLYSYVTIRESVFKLTEYSKLTTLVFISQNWVKGLISKSSSVLQITIP